MSLFKSVPRCKFRPYILCLSFLSLSVCFSHKVVNSYLPFSLYSLSSMLFSLYLFLLRSPSFSLSLSLSPSVILNLHPFVPMIEATDQIHFSRGFSNFLQTKERLKSFHCSRPFWLNRKHFMSGTDVIDKC